MYIHTTTLHINCIVNPKLVGREKKPMVLNHMQAKMMNWCSHFKRISGKVGIFLSRWQSRSCNEFPYGSLLILWVYWSKSSRSTSPLLQLFNGISKKTVFEYISAFWNSNVWFEISFCAFFKIDSWRCMLLLHRCICNSIPKSFFEWNSNGVKSCMC